MGWTDPQVELSASDKLDEQLTKLPTSQHASILVTLSLCAANRDQIEPAFFKDISWAGCRAIRYATRYDALMFLREQLEKAPESTTLADVVLLLRVLIVDTLNETDKATTDMQRLVALLPSEAKENT